MHATNKRLHAAFRWLHPGNRKIFTPANPYHISDKQLAKNETILGEGYDLGVAPQNRRRIVLGFPDADRSGHFWGFGSTRVGKTRVMENMIEQDIHKGYSVLVIDPKGDHALFSKIVQCAFETGRQDDLLLITPLHPEYSAHFDPLSHHYIIEELESHIISGVKEGKEPFFADVAHSVSLVIVEALDLLARHEGHVTSIKLREVRDYISLGMFKELKSQVAGIDNPDLRDDVENVVNNLTRIMASENFNKITNSLAVTLQELTSGNLGKIVGNATDNRLITRLEEGKRVIAIVQLGSLLTRKISWALGKIVLSSIQALAGRRYFYGKKNRLDPPLCVYMDEAGDILYPGIDILFSQGGGAAVWLHAFSQSLGQLFKALGQDAADIVLDNCNTKLFMRINNPAKAAEVSDYFGERKLFSPMFGTDGALSFRETEEPLVRASKIMKMKIRQFFLKTYSGIYAGKTADVSPQFVDLIAPDSKGSNRGEAD